MALALALPPVRIRDRQQPPEGLWRRGSPRSRTKGSCLVVREPRSFPGGQPIQRRLDRPMPWPPRSERLRPIPASR